MSDGARESSSNAESGVNPRRNRRLIRMIVFMFCGFVGVSLVITAATPVG